MNDQIKRLMGTDIWFNYQNFYTQISKKEHWKTFVEVGVWKGHSLSFLASLLRGREDLNIYAVDLFENTYRWQDEPRLRSQVEVIYDVYNAVLDQSNTRDMITDLKGLSWEMANNFEDGSVDFVFIDADHAYESVKKDIEAWLPKVKNGGYLSGHDYASHAPGVISAVNEKFSDVITTPEGVWYLEV